MSVGTQCVSLGCFLLLGLGLGLLYDVLRPIRYGSRFSLLWDGLFCAAAALGCFVLAMSKGRLGIWDAAATCLGFCLYINFLSPLLLPHFWDIAAALHNCYKIIVKAVKKLQIIVKKIFTNPCE